MTPGLILMAGFLGVILLHAGVGALWEAISDWRWRRHAASLPRVTSERPCPYCGSDAFAGYGPKVCRCGQEVYVESFIMRCPCCGEKNPSIGESWCPKCAAHLWTGTVVKVI